MRPYFVSMMLLRRLVLPLYIFIYLVCLSSVLSILYPALLFSRIPTSRIWVAIASWYSCTAWYFWFLRPCVWFTTGLSGRGIFGFIFIKECASFQSSSVLRSDFCFCFHFYLLLLWLSYGVAFVALVPSISFFLAMWHVHSLRVPIFFVRYSFC